MGKTPAGISWASTWLGFALLVLLLAFPLPLLAARDVSELLAPAGLELQSVSPEGESPGIVESVVVSNGQGVGRPDIYQQLLVYDEVQRVDGKPSGPYRVCTMDIGSGSTTLLSSGFTGSQMMPRVYGADVVWVDWGSSRILRYNAANDPSVSPLAGSVATSSFPAIHGNFAAYVAAVDTGNKVHLVDISTGEDLVVDPGTQNGSEDFPSLADGLIAFQQTVDAVTHVKLYSFPTDGRPLQMKLVLDTGSFAPSTLQTKPQLDGRDGAWNLVWLGINGSNSDLYGYSSTGGLFSIMTASGHLDNPALQGDLAVWQKPKSGGLYDLWGFSLSRRQSFPLSAGPGSRSLPRVYGDNVVWSDGRSGGPEIYMATVRWAQATATATPTAVPSPTPTFTQTAVPTLTPTPPATDTATPTPTSTPTSTATPTPTVTPTSTSTASPTPVPSETSTVANTATPSHTPTSTPTSTATVTPTSTPTVASTATETPTTTSTLAATPTATVSPTPTLTETPTPTATASHTPTSTPTLVSTPTDTATPTFTPTTTPAPTDEPTPTPTPVPSPTSTATATPAPGPAVAGWYGDDDPRIQFSSGWSVWTGSGPDGGSAHRSSLEGAQAQFSFHGSTVALISARGPEEGVAEVTIDGVPQPEAVLYHADTMEWQQAVSYPVSSGEHVMTVRVSGSRAMNSYGYDVVIDGFVVDPTPTATTTPTSTPTPTALPVPTDTPVPQPSSTPTVGSFVPGYIEGLVKLQARGDHSGVVVTAGSHQSTTTSAGNYSLSVPPGSYRVTVSYQGYLITSRDGVVVGAGDSVVLPPLKLLSGNLVDSGSSADSVDEVDLTFLEEHFGLPDSADPDGHAARADLTADGRVDLFDLVAVTSNWGKQDRDYRW